MENINKTSSTNKNLASEDLALSLCSSALSSDTTGSRFLKLTSSCWTRDPIIWSLFVFNRSNLKPTSINSLNSMWALLISVSERLSGRLFYYTDEAKENFQVHCLHNLIHCLKSKAMCGCSVNIFLTIKTLA